MSSLLKLCETGLSPRYGDVETKKLNGATYTPPELATFVAWQILHVAQLPKMGVIRVLDPAVGDGALLDSLLRLLPIDVRSRVDVWGYDTDTLAIDAASARLAAAFPSVLLHIEHQDFLKHALTLKGGDLFSMEEQEPFHLVIANPPYVRTQILGANQSRELAQSFGLSGRVDLYYPFLLGISKVLAVDGVAGVITSNRFMTTKSGESVRQAMLSCFHIAHVWDLGDTKLFDAAVLPSVLVAKGVNALHRTVGDPPAFSTIYETKDAAQIHAVAVLDALDAPDDAVAEVVDGRRFRVRHGSLDNGGNPKGVWRVTTAATESWLATVAHNTWQTFRHIGKVRVGVKSTADKVFIRSDWGDLPEGRPELLRPLLTRHCAHRFRSVVPEKAKHRKEILYPHESVDGLRSAVDLSLYPNARHYLERHREALEARTYVLAAGRNWYELWVPQDPSAWSAPKLVFPDISEKPVFWIDTDGGVVNGECYWLCSEDKAAPDLLWLALAVANSTFIEAFYDHKFNNKLYAGRRRFITQYVEQFPLPNPALDETRDIVALVKDIHAITPSTQTDAMESRLDDLVWNIFGLGEKSTR